MIRLILPMPHRFFSPNVSAHWFTKGEQTRKFRYLSKLAARVTFRDTLLNPKFEPFRKATIKRVFYFRLKRRRDHDNLNSMCKCITDGIIDSGILIDDDLITWLPTEINVDHKGIQSLEYHFFNLEY